jgi:DNA-binding IclR family transcriptional regulator
MAATALRKRCQVRNSTLQAALATLVAEGRARKDHAGYTLAR